MTYTRSEIRQARLTWINFLMMPSRKKAKNTLDTGQGNRCCLGHGCFILGGTVKIRDEEGFITYDGMTDFPPDIIVERLGLWSQDGGSFEDRFELEIFEYKSLNVFQTLSIYNDETDATPQQIGKYLLSVIEGGLHTPFKPLTDYQE